MNSTYESVSKSFRTESITKYTLTTINTSWEATQRVMTAKLTRLAHKIAIQLHLVAQSCTICSSRSRQPVRKLLDTPSYFPSKLTTRLHLVPRSKNEWSYTFTLQYAFMSWCSVKAQGQLYLYPKNGGSMHLWNVCILLQNYKASQLRTLLLHSKNFVRSSWWKDNPYNSC
jgi:hypothetical protein